MGKVLSCLQASLSSSSYPLNFPGLEQVCDVGEGEESNFFLIYIYNLFMEKAMAPHSSTLAWKIHGQRSLVGCSPWGR